MNFLIVEDDNIQLTGLKHIIEEEYADAVVNTASTYNEFPNTMTHLSSSSPTSPFQTLMSSTSIIASIISQSLMTESMS